MTAPVFAGIVGQNRAISTLIKAKDSPTHAWLFTGPPGSGRSNIAIAFATLLICSRGGCGSCTDCQTARLGSHPDVELFKPEGGTIKVDEIRELVSRASWGASIAPYRVTIIEDCDRMTESAASALLKAIEEPGSQNIWLLCAPTTDDVLSTIKSRCRLVSLITPTTNEVSVFLQETLKVENDRAEVAARISQGHIGSARHLATDIDLLQIRKKIIKLFLSIDSEARAITTASQLQDIAVTRSEISLKKSHKEEEEELRLTVQGPNRGLLSGGSKALKDLEKSQKSRTVRAAKDELDSYFLWLQTLLRDALLPESSGTKFFINPDQHDEIHELRRKVSPRRLQNLFDRVHQFRSLMDSNVSQILTLEAFCLDFFNLIHGR